MSHRMSEEDAAGAAAGLLGDHEARRDDFRVATDTPAGAILVALIQEHTSRHEAPELRGLASGGTQADLDRAAAAVVEAIRGKAPAVATVIPHTIIGSLVGN